MAKKLGSSSGRYKNTLQTSRMQAMMDSLMERHDIDPDAIRQLGEPEPLTMVPTQVAKLDDALSGGIPRPSIAEFYGDSQGGKSWLATKVMAPITNTPGCRALYVDAEMGFNPFRAYDCGVNLWAVDLWDSYESGEQVLNSITEMVSDANWQEDYEQPKPYDVIVIDSIAVLPCEEEVIGKTNSIGNRARMISKWQRKILPALSRSKGHWEDEITGLSTPDGIIEISPKSIGQDLWDALAKVTKTRKKYKDQNLFDPEINEKVGDIDPAVMQFESAYGFKVLEFDTGLIKFQKYNPGTLIVVVNQVRLSDFGNYLGPKKIVTGGQASLYMAGTRIEIQPIGGKKGKIQDEDGNVEFYLSRAKIVKSRHTRQVIDGIEIKIPATETDMDQWDEFLELLESRELYWFGRGYHHVPKPGGEIEPFIKTKDAVEFLDLMMSGGLDFVMEELGWDQEQIDPYRELCAKKISDYTNGIATDGSQVDEEDEEDGEDMDSDDGED